MQKKEVFLIFFTTLKLFVFVEGNNCRNFSRSQNCFFRVNRCLIIYLLCYNFFVLLLVLILKDVSNNWILNTFQE